ncbi:MAG TPA: amidohydrolase family protein [Pirellulales bacterium]|jgi:N-acetylglucosamine-6-phosphate deacetylase
MNYLRSSLVVAICLVLCGDQGPARAAPRIAPFPGLREPVLTAHAITGARIVVSPDRTIENGTIVFRDGVIVAVGEKVTPPADAQIHDAKGKTVYAGFIDAYSELPADASRAVANDKSGAGYWNGNILPQVAAIAIYAPDNDANRKYRSQGVAVRLVAPSAGIIKGASALVTTGDESGRETILKDQVALHAKLTTARGLAGYPNSPMGAYTLVRQALYDAGWYSQAWHAYEGNKDLPRPERSDALAALRGYLGGKQPVMIDAADEIYFLRADRIGKEFGLDVIVRGSGDEYRRLADIVATKRSVIVPLDFPKAPNVSTPEGAANVSLERLMHWDIAPENPARLADAGVKFAFTTRGLKDPGALLGAVRKAVERGLKPEAALRALTVTPAELFGMADRLGTLESGKAANIVVASGDLLQKKSKVLETWVDGRRYEIEASPTVDVRGTWQVEITKPDGAKETLTIALKGSPTKLSGKVKRGDKSTALVSPALAEWHFTTSFKGEPLGLEGVLQLTATIAQTPAAAADAVVDLTWLGAVVWPSGEQTSSTAKREKPAEASDADDAAETKEEKKEDDAEKEKPTEANDEQVVKKDEEPAKSDDTEADKKAAEKPNDAAEKADASKSDSKDDAGKKEKSEKPKKPVRALAEVNYPLGEFGRKAAPEQPAAVLFKNATMWTSGPQGLLENADVLIEQGKIKAVGVNLAVPNGAITVDATGKHISPGIIDCHSHIATDGGVNESGQTITAEVRVGDFVDPNDINIYRQLAGGVTSSNILHGSANTIGGQNQVLKFRWGAGPEELKFAAAPQGIKFALGENVKQSNWGERANNRYPQTRMGVEQLVRDAFRAAQQYRQDHDQWNRTKTGLPPRTDLELEALAEVVEGKRLIHCHSYRQDEILALLRTCESFNVKIATLQHILEGYKVADVMAKHGVGGSSFSDWWAFKFEVLDAIPYNGALMHNAGVVVSFNSDDAELARRLNLEASKAVKYGGVQPEEALKFVTLNPAKQLRIDQFVGSLEPGKDADLVVWSASPLSTYGRCEQTWVDGRRYFDLGEDQQLRQDAAKLRAALVQRVLSSGEPTATPEDEKKRESEFWPREDIFCHHGELDGHGH